MDKLNIGQIITTPQHRDAIHVPIAPVVAAEKLAAGDYVGINLNGRATEDAVHIGIVDPFLKRGVKAGETFWLFLTPGVVTDLHHEWTHAAFAAPVVAKEPEAEETEDEDEDDGCRGCYE